MRRPVSPVPTPGSQRTQRTQRTGGTRGTLGKGIAPGPVGRPRSVGPGPLQIRWRMNSGVKRVR